MTFRDYTAINYDSFFFRLFSVPYIQILHLSVLLLLQEGVLDFKEKGLLLLKLKCTQGREKKHSFLKKTLKVSGFGFVSCLSTIYRFTLKYYFS
jgi:hypothetical protein